MSPVEEGPAWKNSAFPTIFHYGAAMTDLSEIEKLLQTAGKGRASAPRLKDGVVRLVLDVTGLGQVQREVLEAGIRGQLRSEEHTSELQSLMRISYDVFCLTNKSHNLNQ